MSNTKPPIIMTFTSLDMFSLFGNDDEDSAHSVLDITVSGQTKVRIKYFNFNDRMSTDIPIYQVELFPWIQQVLDGDLSKRSEFGVTLPWEVTGTNAKEGKISVGKDDKGYYFGFRTSVLPKEMKYRFNPIHGTINTSEGSNVDNDVIAEYRLRYWLSDLKRVASNVGTMVAMREARQWTPNGEEPAEIIASGTQAPNREKQAIPEKKDNMNGAVTTKSNPAPMDTYDDDIPF